MNIRPQLLVVCGRNKRRSRTAEFIFKNDNRFHIRSVGVSSKSDRKITENDLRWADRVFVMEKEQRNKIVEIYAHMDLPPIEIFYIPDEYDFMDEELVKLLDYKINESYQSNF